MLSVHLWRITLRYSFISESSVKVGDFKRAKKSTYIKSKQKESIVEAALTSRAINNDNLIMTTSKSPNDLSDMLRASDLKDDKDSKPFRFDFHLPTSDDRTINIANNEVNKLPHDQPTDGIKVQSLHFKPSDNSFRFDFKM